VTKRVERRLEVLCDDRLDVRIDASAYDKRAREIRQHQDQVRRRISERQATELPPVNQAVDVMALASKAANLFVEQPGAEQQKFLRLVFENASWKGGELRMSFRKPFSELSVSNRATRTNDDCLQRVEGDSGMWRGKRDSFGQGVCAFCNLQILRSGRRARTGRNAGSGYVLVTRHSSLLIVRKSQINLPQAVLLLLLNKQLHTARIIPIHFLNRPDKIGEVQIIESAGTDFALKHFVACIPPTRQRLIVARDEFHAVLKCCIQFPDSVFIPDRCLNDDVGDDAHRFILVLCGFVAARAVS